MYFPVQQVSLFQNNNNSKRNNNNNMSPKDGNRRSTKVSVFGRFYIGGTGVWFDKGENQQKASVKRCNIYSFSDIAQAGKSKSLCIHQCFSQLWWRNWAIDQSRSWYICGPNLEFVKPSDQKVRCYKALAPNIIGYSISESYAYFVISFLFCL